MKQIVFIAIGLGIIVALGATIKFSSKPAGTTAPPATATASFAPRSPSASLAAADASNTSVTSVPGVHAQDWHSAPETEAQCAYRQAIETLLSPLATFEDKQAVLKQLVRSGQLDDAIRDLQQRLAADPQSLQNLVALGEADLKKHLETDDIREVAISAMQADQLFDKALEIDPNDWEARFEKAAAMANWPLELKQGPKVLDEFQTLIQQQNSEPSQPDFALTYLHLGEFYQRTGDTTAAAQTWQQGAALFPDSSDLQSKLSHTP
jgi:tetratricopeptide (TPR) repeat protein